MRFKIINSNRSLNSVDKSEQNQVETRPNSSSKSTNKHSFLQMVKSSYQYYSTIGKDILKEQQIKALSQKQQKLKKQQKKLNLKQLRQQQKQSQANQQMQDIERQIRKAKLQDQKNKRIKKAPNASTRTSKRIKANDISHLFKKQNNEIFDVLNLEPSKIALQEEKTIQFHQQKIGRKQRLKENIQKLQKQLIFQEEGTYQLNLAHQVMLKAQKTIDEHINFKHEVRQSKVMDMNELIKYMKIHGFSTFNEKTFNLLTSINPYLYSYREPVQANKVVIQTFKLNSIQISQRLESTRRRMSQVSVPELLT